jgi:hypothetical protein
VSCLRRSTVSRTSAARDVGGDRLGRVVVGSKFLHHLLPDLIPPVDRRYTFRFFTGYQAVTSDQTSFLDWFPKLAGIGNRCRASIYDVIVRGGFMATGEAKVIDNAIMGFMQNRQT